MTEYNDDGPIFQAELGKMKRVTVSPFKNMRLVHIREYYTKDGETLPGRKGIALTEQQFNELVEHIEEIQDALNMNSESSKNRSRKETKKQLSDDFEDEEKTQEHKNAEIKNEEPKSEELDKAEPPSKRVKPEIDHS